MPKLHVIQSWHEKTTEKHPLKSSTTEKCTKIRIIGVLIKFN